MKFLGYMKLRKLKATILAPENEEVDEDKNEEAYAELIQYLDEKSLSLVMRDAADDGRKALGILREHYAGVGKPRVISLYTELTSLIKSSCETVTEYVIRAETAAASLKNCGENITDSLLIAMVLKGLPDSFKPFVVVVTQSQGKQTFSEFKAALRSFEDTENARTAGDDSVMRLRASNAMPGGQSRLPKDLKCYNCGGNHFARECSKSKKKPWCNHCQSSSHSDQACRKQKELRGKGREDRFNTAFDYTADDEHSFTFKITSGETGAYRSNSVLVDCGATAHIITDETKFMRFDDTFNGDKHFMELADGTRANNVAVKRGDARITLQDKNGQLVNITLRNALLVPSYPQDIFSVQAATENGARVNFQPKSAELIHSSDAKFEIEKHGRLYFLKTYSSTDNINYTCDMQQWHEILGHCNFDDILSLENVVEGMKVSEDRKKKDCNVCMLGKMTNNRNRNPRARSTVPLQLVHTDLAGPIDPVSSEGFKYAIAFTDDYSGASFVYFLHNKSDTVRATEKFLADSAPFGDVKCIRSDNGTEFTCSAFKTLLRNNHIRHETSAPYSPHQNGTAERHWRTVFEMGRCLLIQSGLRKELWPYAVMCATYIRNRCYSKHLKLTPFHALTGKKPNLSNMRVFGSECYVYCTHDKKKLDPRSIKGIFVGYDGCSPAYLVYYPDTGKVMKHRVVKFPSTTKENTVSLDQFDDDLWMNPNADPEPDIRASGERPDVRDSGESSSMSDVKDSKKSVSSLTQDSQLTRTTRYPERERKPPKHLDDYVSDFDEDQCMSNVDYCYRVSSFPQSYKEAIGSADSENWKKAMSEEMNSLRENETFTLTTLPEGRKSVGGRWVFTVKESSDGSKSYKARYVAKGYSQVEGIDYKETFAPTANMTSIRSLMQIAAQHDLILHQMDVKTAYLNAPIDCEIYMEQAEGFEVPGKEDRLVYKLNKSLYGLKQSGRNWNSLLHSYLQANKFAQSPTDHCVYIQRVEKDIVMIVVWVDDLIIAASNESLLTETKQMLKDKFNMKDLGKLSYFLGIDFKQENGLVKMNQKRYLLKILDRFEMVDCKPRSTPSELKIDCMDSNPVDPRKYREVVGSLIYAMTCTRPDICWVITRLSQYLSKPLQSHWVAIKHVLRYIRGTLDYELCYKKCTDGLALIGYSDADWASSEDDRRSTSGYCFSLTGTGPLISWKSRKQQTVALSSCEAEYVALAAAVQEGLYLKQWFESVEGIVEQGPVLIFEDNQGTIALSCNPVGRQRSKHIDIRYHFIREVLKKGI
ncbi:MAG: reverse transcriptase domain-containing protein [Candidatus Thiodiazotropha endolucinida]|nr:reverse transcriptase domain-containing protein [Candidatus Thiodiazotropha endolucinida]